MTFAVKGVFRIDTRFGGSRSGRQTVFESRIVLVRARSEREARASGRKRFAGDVWEATWPAADIAHQSQKYVGISRIISLGGELECGEVWYEFSDTAPAVERGKRGVIPRRNQQRGARRRLTQHLSSQPPRRSHRLP